MRVRQRDGAFDHPLQFAHVAGPLVDHQRLHRIARQPIRLAVGRPLQDGLDQVRDVVAAGTQGRHGNLDGVQAIEQVPAELAASAQRLERPVGRHHDPDVDAAAAVAADALHRRVLDHPQQLGLRRRREVGDFVEEQRAAVGLLELAAPATHTGGRPLLDPEQLRLEQRLDDRRAVERHEWPVGAIAQRVHASRDQFLARSALSLDQHDEVLAGRARDAFVELPHHRRGAEEVALVHAHRAQDVARVGLAFHVAQQRLERQQHADRRTGGRQRRRGFPSPSAAVISDPPGTSARPRPRSSGSPARWMVGSPRPNAWAISRSSPSRACVSARRMTIACCSSRASEDENSTRAAGIDGARSVMADPVGTGSGTCSTG